MNYMQFFLTRTGQRRGGNILQVNPPVAEFEKVGFESFLFDSAFKKCIKNEKTGKSFVKGNY